MGVDDTETSGKAEVFADARGKLTLIPFDRIPFSASRAYVLSELPDRGRRAGHACRTQHRFLVGLSGRASITLDDGTAARHTELAGGDTVHVPPATWIEIEALVADVTILVFADGEYDPEDYVADRSELPIAISTASTTRDT